MIADLRRPTWGFKRVALMFVGHGEPATVEDGDVPIVFSMLVSNSIHTDEIAVQMEEVNHLTSDMEVLVTEPFFEIPYMNADMTVKETEIIDQWSAADPLFYSPWGVNVIEHSGTPMIIVGLNIPELVHLEDGSGGVLSYHRESGAWIRSVVRSNPDPTVTNYNAMIVVAFDIDNDGDDDLALSGAFGTSSVGNWLENTGDPENPWIPHLLTMDPATDPNIRGTLA